MLKRFLLLTLILSFGICTVRAQTEAAESNLKAAFIYNFTKFIDWGTSIPHNEFVIGVIGKSPVTESLEEIARTKTVNEKKIIIHQFSKPEEITSCNILFISKNTSFSIENILTKWEAKGTLIISEKEGYAMKGAAFNFVIVDDKLKFEANTKALSLAGLTASSQLLKLAIIVFQN